MAAVNYDRLLKLFVDLCSVDTFHPNEAPADAMLRAALQPCGVTFTNDAIGNLIGTWPAKGKTSEPIMLNAHTDTVWATPTMKPIVKDDGVWSDESSVLGADDKAGVAAIVEAVLVLHESGEPHGLVELVFTVGEDVGHIGSKAFDPASVKSRRAFVLDGGGPVGGIVVHAPGQRRMIARFKGKAAHAGVEPEKGRSAIVMLAKAIAKMPHGRIDNETTANIGSISGGQAYNIVAETAELKCEARSLDSNKLIKLCDRMIAAMQDAAHELEGTVHIEDLNTYRGFQLADDDPAVVLADKALRACGVTPVHKPTGGGSDANEFMQKGITSVVLAAGYVDVHSVKEFMPHDQLRKLAEVTIELIRHA